VAHDCAKHLLPSFGYTRCYSELKAAAMNGHPDKLTEDERAFVGVVVHERDTSGGWRSLQDSTWEIDSVLSPEDMALLQSLMNAGSIDRVEFLGG
jgi:hypothetical protein